MRGVLSFIYVGEVAPSLVDSQSEALFSVAHQYFLNELVQLAEARLITSIAADTLKGRLVLAQLHDAKALKDRCFAFVRQNKVTALTNPSMLSLAAEQPALSGASTLLYSCFQFIAFAFAPDLRCGWAYTVCW